MSDTVPDAEDSTALVDALGDGIYRLDADGRVLRINDALLDLTGYSREALEGAHVSMLFGAATRDRLGDADGTAVDVVIETSDSGQIPCEVRVNAVSEGRVGVVRERSTADDEDDVRTPPNSVSAVIEEADIGVFVLDADRRVVWADTTVERYFGLGRCAVVGRDKREVIEEQITDHVADGERFAETLLAAYADGRYPNQFECHVTPGEDREERWLEQHSEPIESGEYAGGRIELYYDVTDRKRSEGSLRDAEERFRSLVDAVEEYAIFRLDTDGTVISWNEGARSIKGYDADEILGRHFSAFYTEADRADGVPQANLDAAYRNGSVEDEGWRVRQDGSQFWATVTITAVYDDGSHKGYLKVTRDLTDRHLRERELESELEQMLGRISDAFYAVDDEFRFTHVNERAEQLLGYSQEELEGTVMWKALPEGPGLYGEFQHALTRQESTSFERYFEPLGIWAEVNVYPSETGLSVYLRDVTERKERERELELFKNLLDQSNDALLISNPETGAIHDVNDTAVERLGYTRAELLDMGIPDVETELSGREEWRTFVEELRAEGQTTFNGLHQRKDGSTFPVEVEVSHAEFDQEYVLSIARDVTERREYERKLEASNERLEQFAYSVSHDLQEPLRMVSSYLQLIEERYGDVLDEDGQEFLAFAVDGADRMKAMIEGLLAYSRVETRGDPLEPTDLDSVLADVCTDLQLRIEESGAEITADSLPTVVGDENQLRQVFQNLVENAIEYSGEAPPAIRIDAERDGQQWRIDVHDEGVGIEAADQERIFEVFERLHTQRDHDGTGIGLSLVERIVERHGGEIWVDCEPGEGTTFSFTLPAAEE
ncbi:PAS domain S-box protein [Halolamina salifodinae]|uniref:histidine kinase n=1 Tax=Halolamina salifodinae TaxID=1202767 RepID=A0A8T4H2X5_9EURY|nr:PAS domain S-box protein [Halolamina salifodinae]MBP1987568.1 PAS domain S-box-containing protein [Halolamina salifodinae]